MPRASPETTAKPAGAEIASEPLGKPHARGRGVARADEGDRRQLQHGRMAAHRHERRGVIDHLQAAGIIGLAERNEGHAGRVRRLELALGILARGDATRTFGAAAAGEFGDRRQGRARPAVMIDQRAECARADIVAADQAQPIEPLLVVEPHALVCFTHDAPRALPPGDSIADAHDGDNPNCTTDAPSCRLTRRAKHSEISAAGWGDGCVR